MTRLNVLQDKIEELLGLISTLRIEKDTLTQENASLKSSLASHEERLGELKESSTQFVLERDDIKERVERLIQMIDR